MTDPPRRPRWLQVAAVITSLAVGGLGLTVLIAAIPVWPLELFEHFRVQLIAFGLVTILAAFALRVRGYFDGALIATLLHLVAVLPGLRASARVVPTGTPVRVLLSNVHTSSSGFAELSALIADTSPDVVALVEVDQRWLDALAPTLVGYSARIEHPRSDNFGVALYARGALAGGVEDVGGALPSIVANVAIGTATFAIILTHPLPPVTAEVAEDLTVQLDAIADRSREYERVIVMGDFNATPWSRPFRRLRDRSGLCDSRDGFGIQATFPAGFWPLRIPIDHVLGSCSIGVRDRRVERDIGSDHLPVVVDLVIHAPARTSGDFDGPGPAPRAP